MRRLLFVVFAVLCLPTAGCHFLGNLFAPSYSDSNTADMAKIYHQKTGNYMQPF